MIRKRFDDPETDLTELFSRMSSNSQIGNTDDNGRNQAAFSDGKALLLPPTNHIASESRGNRAACQATNTVQGNRRP